jgi:serine protease AprX
LTDRLTHRLIRLLTAAAWVCLAAMPAAAGPGQPAPPGQSKLDSVLAHRSQLGIGDSRIIIELADGAPQGLVQALGGTEGRRLRTYNGQVAWISNNQLIALAKNPWVKSVHVDRPTAVSMKLVAEVVGARAVRDYYGYDGSGVGVAVIDSGITSWHDDLMGSGIGGQKVVKFVDFVNHHTAPYDDNGHGTHVAGIIAGSGYDTFGTRAGIAPGAHLVSLKVLGQNGGGYISDVIAALDWVYDNHTAYNVRVVNLSVAAAVTESYTTDPLTLATRRVVEAGVVVVAAAGNFGKNAYGYTQYGGITAPGNAPWVLTVGASSHMGTATRTDDTIADFSSRGPTARDLLSKPDIVAPGVGTVSLSAPSSLFYSAKSPYLLWGYRWTTFKPYMSLSGTSMAAPVVAGSVALMLQANPALTPNAVKAILEYTAEWYPQYNVLTQGAGFLNTRGAVRLAQFFRHARAGDVLPGSSSWSRHIIWGNHVLGHGMILPTANAWATNIVWGATRGAAGDNIVWGTACRADSSCDNIVWGVGARSGENIVWGSGEALDNIVWGVNDGDNIVWGVNDGDNIVWGVSSDGDNIVWGVSRSGDNIVWGTARDTDNIVWGTAVDSSDNIVWGVSSDGDNIVWGVSSDGDNIVWGVSRDGDNIVWGVSSEPDGVLWNEEGDLSGISFDSLFGSPPGSGTGGTDSTSTSSSTTGGF